MEDIEDLLYKDAFIKFIMKQLDYYEDLLYSSSTNPYVYIEAKGKVELLKQIRDFYSKQEKEVSKVSLVSATYCWYDQGKISGTGLDLDINKVILSHHWGEFNKYYRGPNNREFFGKKPAVYFPETVQFCYSDGHIENRPLNEDTFNQITAVEQHADKE